MKKILIFLLVATILMTTAVLGGCKKEAEEEKPTTTKAEAANQETTTEAVTEETQESDAEEPISGEVNIWTWASYDERLPIINLFNETYPDITIKYTSVESKDMPMKVQTALASGSEIGDVIWCEIGQRGQMLALDCWEDLEAEPYNLDRSDLLPFDVPQSITPSGKLVGVNGAPGIGTLAYKRDLAIEYFGTDDPDALAEMFPTWNSLLEAGKDLMEKSNGEVYLFSALSELYEMVKGTNTNPLVIDNKLNLTAALGPAFEILIAFKEAGIVDDLDMWTPAWDSTFSEETNMFNYCPSWAPTWIYKSKAPESTSGNWGLMLAPEGGFIAGGTNKLIPSAAEDKMAAYIWIKWRHLSVEGSAKLRDYMSEITGYAKVYEDYPDFFSFEDPFFGGQDILKLFATDVISSTNPPRQTCKYDVEINDAAAIAVKAINDADGEITVEEIIDFMEEEILNKVPELEAE